MKTGEPSRTLPQTFRVGRTTLADRGPGRTFIASAGRRLEKDPGGSANAPGSIRTEEGRLRNETALPPDSAYCATTRKYLFPDPAGAVNVCGPTPEKVAS